MKFNQDNFIKAISMVKSLPDFENRVAILKYDADMHSNGFLDIEEYLKCFYNGPYVSKVVEFYNDLTETNYSSFDDLINQMADDIMSLAGDSHNLNLEELRLHISSFGLGWNQIAKDDRKY